MARLSGYKNNRRPEQYKPGTCGFLIQNNNYLLLVFIVLLIITNVPIYDRFGEHLEMVGVFDQTEGQIAIRKNVCRKSRLSVIA